MAISAECGQAIVGNGLYWWHRAILEEVTRIEAYGKLTTGIIAENMKYVTQSLAMDTRRNLNALEEAGMITRDGDEDLRITYLGREWVG